MGSFFIAALAFIFVISAIPFLFAALEASIERRILFPRLPAWNAGAESALPNQGAQPDLQEITEEVRSAAGGFLLPSGWDQLFCRVDRLADYYLSASAKERVRIRKFARRNTKMYKVLLRFARLSAQKMDAARSDSENLLLLRRGLAALSIDNQTEFRASWPAVGDLKEAASRVGLEPKDAFREAQSISSNKPEGAPASKMFEIEE